MLRKILAVVLGVVAAVIIIIAIEALGHSIYPPPDNLDVANREAMEVYVASLPLAALLFVMTAWIADHKPRVDTASHVVFDYRHRGHRRNDVAGGKSGIEIQRTGCGGRAVIQEVVGVTWSRQESWK